GLSSIDRIEPKKVLKNILDDKVIYGYSGEDFSELEKYITGIYERYGISCKKSKYREPIIENFISTLDSVDVDITDFILSEFVLTENSIHKINKEEKRNLEKIFYQNLPFDWITFTIKNSRYNGGFITDKIGIEINENIIRKWNTVSQKPVLDSTGLTRKTDIVLYTDFVSS
ncbi:MAG TPA: hypothetical protein VJ896_01145, partial [Bacteroidales bacterium]|nr:hypothetical protein [Bacteroidales bacterium]